MNLQEEYNYCRAGSMLLTWLYKTRKEAEKDLTEMKREHKKLESELKKD